MSHRLALLLDMPHQFAVSLPEVSHQHAVLPVDVAFAPNDVLEVAVKGQLMYGVFLSRTMMASKSVVSAGRPISLNFPFTSDKCNE
jgi:hypothetical protein